MKKTYLITGSNSGIGYSATLEMARKEPDSIFLLPSRTMAKAQDNCHKLRQLTGNMNMIPYECDLSNFEDIYSLSEKIKENYSALDVLVNNAGVFKLKKTITPNHLEETYQVNYFAPFLLTQLLLDLLDKSENPRIVNVSSVLHFRAKSLDFKELIQTDSFQNMDHYCKSKLALILFNNQLAYILRDQTKYSINSLHPGGVSTRIARDSWFFNLIAKIIGISPEKGAKPIIYLAQDPESKNFTGKYFDKENKKPVPSSPLSYICNLNAELYSSTLKYFNLSPKI